MHLCASCSESYRTTRLLADLMALTSPDDWASDSCFLAFCRQSGQRSEVRSEVKETPKVSTNRPPIRTGHTRQELRSPIEAHNLVFHTTIIRYTGYTAESMDYAEGSTRPPLGNPGSQLPTTMTAALSPVTVPEAAAACSQSVAGGGRTLLSALYS